MKTVNSLKRPLTVSSDPLKLLLCKICKKDDVVLHLKTCGCLFCDSCDGDSPKMCISCDSEVDQKIKLSFTKNPRCKFYEHNKCYNSAEYKCRCLPNCFVCSSCLTYVHRKRVRESCVPEMMRPKVTTNYEPCELCKEFIAEFKMTSEPHTKICFDCKTNKNAKCTPYEKKSDKDADWNQFYKDFEQSSLITSDKIKKLKEVVESSSSARDQEIKKCKDAMFELQKCLNEYTEQYARHIATLKKQLDNFKKISNILKTDGTIKTILDLLKAELLTLHGEKGKEQIIDLLLYLREKNSHNHRYPLAEKIKTFIIQNASRRQHLLEFPLPSSSNSGVSAKSGVSVQEIIDNGVKPFVILVEKLTEAHERKKILEAIQKHEDKWIRKERFGMNDIVVIFDAKATGSPKCKRAKVLSKGNRTSTVFLLDFGLEITVKNSSIGEFSDIIFHGKKTCYLAQLTGNIFLNCDFKQTDWISKIPQIQNGFPKAQHLHVID
ncbi:uncharacterized protein LOC107360548 isoform X1 [Tetranychus urticae]|uniref:Uncharacterized protein n=1 Tax=Tetranychus urticae TaxID=32264 RepID=T1K6B4_TETUR|nr:uncharacterized protein LOC107360548 isoform X1 [Tetranychus urticae]